MQSAFFGFGEAFVTPFSAALITDICKKRHFGTAMGTFGTTFDIGHATGPILAGILIAKWDYLHAFWLMAAILLIFVPVFMLSVDVDKPLKMAYPKTGRQYKERSIAYEAGTKYGFMMVERQNEIQKKTEEISALIQKKQKSKNILKAKDNLKAVLLDGSTGVHNYVESMELLSTSSKALTGK
jgi:MFS family permease